jgi:hypothetical protein
MIKHYILGAGMVGCLYDYGPEACATKDDALDVARWYLYGAEDLAEVDVVRILAALAKDEIYYFTQEERHAVGADYIEVSEANGECPPNEEE